MCTFRVGLRNSVEKSGQLLSRSKKEIQGRPCRLYSEQAKNYRRGGGPRPGKQQRRRARQRMYQRTTMDGRLKTEGFTNLAKLSRLGKLLRELPRGGINQRGGGGTRRGVARRRIVCPFR